MALQGKLILNGADYVPFNLYGVGVFMAHSGLGTYRNNINCAAIAKSGPIPPGKYWIVDRKDSLVDALLVNRTGLPYGAMIGESMMTPG